MSENTEKTVYRTRGPWTEAERELRAQRRAEKKAREAAGIVDPPKKKRGRKPWTDEQKSAFGKMKAEELARKRVERAEKEKEDLERYDEYRKAKVDLRYTPETNAKRSATQKAHSAERSKQREALLAANPGKTKQELGIPRTWKSEAEKEHTASWFLRQARVALDLPPINIKDPEQVRHRIDEYFDYCELNERKPNIVGLRNWLGISGTTFDAWRKGEYNNPCVPMIQKVCSMLEEYAVDQVQETKANPANWLFLIKNWFGYKDQTDVIFGQKEQQEQNMSKEDFENYFLGDGKTIEQKFEEDN